MTDYALTPPCSLVYEQPFWYRRAVGTGICKWRTQTIARWEKGDAEPSLSMLRDLATIMGTSVDDLVEASVAYGSGGYSQPFARRRYVAT